MIDWEEIINAESPDELREAKIWLFKENMRLENERRELTNAQEKFLNERVKFRDEMDELNRRTVIERRRLKEENLFFDKKMAILQDGFRQLDADRKVFEQQKKSYTREIENRRLEADIHASSGHVVDILFRSVNNPLALRKRYKDLVKIFHPDNLFGDEELAQMINKEFMRRRREE